MTTYLVYEQSTLMNTQTVSTLMELTVSKPQMPTMTFTVNPHFTTSLNPFPPLNPTAPHPHPHHDSNIPQPGPDFDLCCIPDTI